MSDLISQINLKKIPIHVAIIMDGNGRWAKKSGKPRVFGHHEGVKSVREITDVASELGIKYLTLYAFSTENWNRPKYEVNALMHLLVETLKREIKSLQKKNVKLTTIGDPFALPHKSRKILKDSEEQTKNNTGLNLIIAMNYSGKWDLVQANKKIGQLLKNGTIQVEDINEELIESQLSTQGIPNPELMIRTSGEYRISNFLLWQLAYSEFYFTDVLWPDYRKEEFYKTIIDFQNRERRFGKTSEQITNKS